MFGRLLKGSIAKNFGLFQRRSISNDIEQAFFQVKVGNPESIIEITSIKEMKETFNKKLNIVIKTHSHDDLPYKDVDLLNPEINSDLQKHGITREPHTRVVYRGDSRPIEEIFEVGGFHPQCTNPSIDFNREKPLDVRCHRHSPWGSGFVATTISQEIAHGFGQSYGDRNRNQTLPHYRYTSATVLATGAMTPSQDKSEDEYSVPGGIDKEDIVAFRECVVRDADRNHRSKLESLSLSLSNIFVSKRFAQKYPHLVQEIVRTQLIGDEEIPSQEHKLGM